MTTLARLDFAFAHIASPQKAQLQKLYAHYADRIVVAKGSKTKHQAWDGGYIDHISDCCEIAVRLYKTLNEWRALPFTLGDVMLVLLIHDLEKPFKYSQKPLTIDDSKSFILELLTEFGITLTPEQKNGFLYVHAEPDSEYSQTERIMNELAAFCHSCDVLSARVYYDKEA